MLRSMIIPASTSGRVILVRLAGESVKRRDNSARDNGPATSSASNTARAESLRVRVGAVAPSCTAGRRAHIHSPRQLTTPIATVAPCAKPGVVGDDIVDGVNDGS